MGQRLARHFFAARRDLEPGSREVEEQLELQYVECSASEERELIRRWSLTELDQLGVSHTGNHLVPAYLVMPRTARVHVQSVRQLNGGVRYIVDQSGNPGSIVLQPGGIFEAKCLVAGHIGTVQEDPGSVELFNRFAKALTRGFRKVRSYWVGPEALELLESGFRLVTMGPDEPREYDLSVR